MERFLKLIGKTIGGIFLAGFGLLVLKFLFHFVFYLGLIFFTVLNIGGEEELVYQYEFEIESMKDNHTYVIHRYSVDSELKYHFMRYRDGSLRAGSTKASESSIIEDGGNKVVVYYEKPKRFQKTYDFLNRMSDLNGADSDTFQSKHYEYHIPKGSVEMDYNIDLE